MICQIWSLMQFPLPILISDIYELVCCYSRLLVVFSYLWVSKVYCQVPCNMFVHAQLFVGCLVFNLNQSILHTCYHGRLIFFFFGVFY